MRRRRPGAMQVDARLVEQRSSPSQRMRMRSPARRRADDRRAQPRLRARASRTARRRRRARTWTTAPSSSAKSAASDVAVASVDVEAAARRERHLDERHEQAAVARCRDTRAARSRVQSLDQREERRERRRVVEVRRLVAELPVAPARAPSRRAAGGRRRGRCARAHVSPRSRRSSGVSVARASATGANAETISDTGAVTALSTPSSRHVVRIDIESLPTGIEMPSATQSSSATARTVSYSAASSPGWPAGAIQFAESLTSPSRAMSGGGDVGDRLADRHAARRRRVDQRERRALADRHRLARVAREVHAASPRRRPPAPATGRPSGRASTGRRRCDRRS